MVATAISRSMRFIAAPGRTGSSSPAKNSTQAAAIERDGQVGHPGSSGRISRSMVDRSVSMANGLGRHPATPYSRRCRGLRVVAVTTTTGGDPAAAKASLRSNAQPASSGRLMSSSTRPGWSAWPRGRPQPLLGLGHAIRPRPRCSHGPGGDARRVPRTWGRPRRAGPVGCSSGILVRACGRSMTRSVPAVSSVAYTGTTRRPALAASLRARTRSWSPNWSPPRVTRADAPLRTSSTASAMHAQLGVDPPGEGGVRQVVLIGHGPIVDSDPREDRSPEGHSRSRGAQDGSPASGAVRRRAPGSRRQARRG